MTKIFDPDGTILSTTGGSNLPFGALARAAQEVFD
jgi:hypothetical protein